MSLTSKYTTFIWDFDGTLFDTYPHTVRGYMEILGEYALTESAAEIERLARISLGDLERYLREKYDLHQDFFDAVVKRRVEIESTCGDPYPAAADFVRRVAAEGGRNMLFTHRDKVALMMLERAGLSDLFCDSIVAGDKDFAWKPAPDAIFALLRRNGVDPAEAIMVGDREIDIGSGKNAGIDSCLIMPYDLTAETVATYKCAGFAEFCALLENLTSALE